MWNTHQMDVCFTAICLGSSLRVASQLFARLGYGCIPKRKSHISWKEKHLIYKDRSSDVHFPQPQQPFPDFGQRNDGRRLWVHDQVSLPTVKEKILLHVNGYNGKNVPFHSPCKQLSRNISV